MSTVTELISRIRLRLEDTSGFHWSDVEILHAINEAKRDLFDHIYARNRDVFDIETTEYTWPIDQMKAKLSEVFSSPGEFEILLISTTSTTATTSADNQPYPVRRISFEELYRYSTGSTRFYGDYFDDSGSSVSWTGGGKLSRATELRWAQQGTSIYLDPIPRVQVKLRFDTIKHFGEFKTDGTENSMEVFPGEESYFKRWERVVEYSASIILKGRSDEPQDPLLMQFQAKLTLLNTWLDSKSQSGTPRVVMNAY